MDNDDRSVHEGGPTESQLLDWVARIRAGERGEATDAAAREMLRDFCVRQWTGVPQSPVVLSWVADAISDILEHREPLEALGLQPRPSSRPQQLAVPFEVACWVRLALERGYSSSEANLLASACFHRDIKTIERDRQRMREETESLSKDIDWEAHFTNLGRPLPAMKESG